MHDQISATITKKHSSNLSRFLKGNSCATALLKMTEDWRVHLDRGKTDAVVVANDLSKVAIETPGGKRNLNININAQQAILKAYISKLTN